MTSAHRSMTSAHSSEERNRLRLQAWEQRNQESSQSRGQNPENEPLFGQPYKTNNGDELSDRIQRMLGNFDDKTSSEPFVVPSSSAFPLTNSLYTVSDPPDKSPKDSSLSCGFNSPKCQNEEFQASQFTANSCSSSGNSMQFSTRGTSPVGRTFSMSHSQAFNPKPLCKKSSAAAVQKPTAYVRPMDGPEVSTESLELKTSAETCTRRPEVLRKPIQGRAIPPLLETLASEIHCVEQILNEMTCSWPPLLSGINSPRAAKTQSSVKVTEEHSPKQENEQMSLNPAFSQQSSSVDPESDRENGTDNPALSNSSRTELAPVSKTPGDWQLDKWINFSQKNNYRSKSHQAAPRSPALSSLKVDLKQPSVNVFEDTSNLPTLNKKTVNLPTPQENQDRQNSLKSHSTNSPNFSEQVKPTRENQNGAVSVHFACTEQDPAPQVKRHHKQSKNVVFESELTTKPIKNKDKKAKVKNDQCTAHTNANNSFHTAPPVKSKSEAKHKRVADLSQKDKYLDGCSQESSKDTQSLVVKINLNLLPKIPQTSESPATQNCNKKDKPHQETNIRKEDKGDQCRPKKKQKLQSNTARLDTCRNSDSSKAEEKRSKEKCEMPLTSSATKDCNQKSKKHLNKEEEKCPNKPKKNSGKSMPESTAKKPITESSSNRPLLKFRDQQFPVKHYIKEAKRLKHKADAESGIAMERDPQISMSSFTMFAETVELIKFVLKLTNSEDLSPTENDLFALCLKCQALLQMAMFRHKEKTAVSYSKTLINHFNSSSESPPDPPSFVNSGPAPSGSSSGPAPSGPSAGVSSVKVPRDIGHVALTYVNITTLFLSAHNLWEQAEEFTNKGSGLLTELNKAMGVLSLTSSMSSMVCYIMQGLHWLQMEPSRP